MMQPTRKQQPAKLLTL